MKRISTSLLLFIAVSSTLPGFAQKKVTEFEQVWLGYVSQTRVTDKWGIWFDANVRTRDHFTNGFNVAFIRPGIMYYLSDNTNLTFGYAFADYFAGNDGRNVAMPEHRPWQQLIWSSKYPKLRLHNRLRLEERFQRKLESPDKLGDGYNFNYRIRYNFSLSTPLSKRAFEPKTISLVFNDEAMLNFGKRIQTNTFDQNRLFGGVNYHLSKQSILQAGYMYTFLQQGTGAQYRNIHTIRVNFLHNPDLRKKKESIN